MALNATKYVPKTIFSMSQKSMKSMMSTLHNEYKQSSSGFSLFGIGSKKSKQTQESTYEASSTAENEASSTQVGMERYFALTVITVCTIAKYRTVIPLKNSELTVLREILQ